MMPRSVAVLLENCLDYAGTFPPARLDLKVAFENYLRYRKGAERALVRSFVCPVSVLKDLPERVESEVVLSVIGTRAENSIKETVEKDFALLSDFSKTHSRDYRVQSYEIRANSPLEIHGSWFEDLHRMFPGIRAFIEIPFDETTLSDSLSALKTENLFGKVRIAERDSVLSGEQLARWLVLCANLRLPFKATAGLHHPIYLDERGTYKHGFLNLFCAGTIAYFGGDEFVVNSILECGDSSEFRFLEDAFEVLGHRAEISRIREAREWLISFGSCSVDEPIEGLEALGYWEAAHAEIQ
ncbi:MAG TPA: hypothetical protein VNK96_03530 [Fimbriimonadales bacterium]|nr:hypothetical protein [Fimbriimonadales bacterium]